MDFPEVVCSEERVILCNHRHTAASLVAARSTLGRLLLAELEVLAALDGVLLAVLALGALKTKGDLLGGLGLLAEDGLGLTTETRLLPVVTTLTLSKKGSLSGLVLGDLVELVHLAPLAEGLTGLGNAN